MKYIPRDYQIGAANAALKAFERGSNGIIVLPTGCHAKGYKILMYDGTLKNVEDIEVGDKVMGNDGTPRNVLSLHRGVDNMYRITPIKGVPFVVNGGHILSLYKTNEGKNYPSRMSGYDEITVSDYVRKSNNYKHLHKLHRSKGVNFDYCDQPCIEPYFVGLVLGDGYMRNHSISITTQRSEVEQFIKEFAEKYDLKVRKAQKKDNLAFSLYISKKIRNRMIPNPVVSFLEEIGIYDCVAGNKFIPHQYLTSDRRNRLELLAGLLDTDASCGNDRKCFEYCTKSKKMAFQIESLCRSLGLYALVGKEKIVDGVPYYRITICGNMSEIPTKVSIRKGEDRIQKKSLYVTGFDVEEVGVGEYFGFELDGNHLYCDWQYFVHHNSGKSLAIALIANMLQKPLLVFQPSKEILEQNYEKLRAVGYDDCSMYSASVRKKEISTVTFATIGSVKAHKEDFSHFQYVIVDEAHLVNSKEGMYHDFLIAEKRCVVGLTATPYRLSVSSFGPMLKFITRTRPRIFEQVLYVVQTRDLVNRGYLANLRYFDLTNMDMTNLLPNSNGTEYSNDSILREFERIDFYSNLVATVKRLLHPKSGVPRKGILVFTQFVKEAERLASEIEGCEIVTGETTKKVREDKVRRFRNGEIKVIANCNCLSEDTEILTRNKGWVGMNDIEPTDLIAQYDNGEITFSEPQRIIKNGVYENDFVCVEGKYQNICVTKNHRMLYAKMGKYCISNERIEEAEKLIGEKIYIPVSGISVPDESVIAESKKINTSFRRFVNYNSYNYRKNGYSREESERMATELYERRMKETYKKPSELTLDECRFIGLWIGDGNATKAKRGGLRYSLVQSYRNPNLIRWIDELLDRCGIYFTSSDNEPQKCIIRGKKCDVRAFKQYNFPIGTGGNKQYIETNFIHIIPYLQKDGTDLFWGLNEEQYYALNEGLFKANGYHGDNNEYKGQYWLTSSKKLSDLMQAIGSCRGFRTIQSVDVQEGYKTLYRLSIRKARYHELVHDVLGLRPNNDKMRTWCVTMPKGTIVTRRKGRVAIVGNCLSTGFDYPELDTIVFARPTLSLAIWYQCVGRALRPSQGKDGWIVDLSGTYRHFGRVEDLVVEKVGGKHWAVTSNGRQLTNTIF